MSDKIHKHAEMGLVLFQASLISFFYETLSPWFWGEIKQFYFYKKKLQETFLTIFEIHT